MKKENNKLDETPSASGSRRAFIQTLGAGIAAAGLPSYSNSASSKSNDPIGAEERVPEPPASRSQAGSSMADIHPSTIVKGPAGALIVEQLKSAGIRYIFHTNTTGMEPIFDAVALHGGIEVIMFTDERLAVAAAEGYALATGELGFFIGSGVGVGNALSSVYNAWKDRTPLLVAFGRNPLKYEGGQDNVEEWDEHLKPTEPFTAWNWSCVDAVSIPAVVRRAIERAYAPPGAPVTLDFPYDLFTQEIQAPIYSFDPKSLWVATRAESSLIEATAKYLAEARSPIFVVGHEVTRRHANGALLHLANKLSIPVFEGTELFSEFPTDNALFMGDYRIPVRFPHAIDLVIVLGSELELPPPSGARLIHVSCDYSCVGRRFLPDLAIVASVETVIADVSSALDGYLTAASQKRIRDARLAVVNAYMKEIRNAREMAFRANFDSSPLTWERVGFELESALGPNTIVVPELGTQKDKLFSQMKIGPGAKRRIGRTRGWSLGWGVAAALGVQLGSPDHHVLALQGDGGFLFGQTEALWSAARYSAPMLFIIMNNHSYNETRNRTLANGGAQFQLGRDMTSYLGDPDVDFAKIAAAYNIQGEKVGDPDSLRKGLKRAVDTIYGGRPFLLDVEVERDGILADSTWHPDLSITALGKKIRGD
jgi:thiamine pyrophosphate-dependent acetolactate synthase large subunit-like protein